MAYTIHSITLTNYNGGFEMNGINYSFQFTNTNNHPKQLVVSEIDEDGRIADATLTLQNSDDYFNEVNRIIQERYRSIISEDVFDLPIIIQRLLRYDVVISGSKEDNEKPIRTIVVIFQSNFNRVVILNPNYRIIKEENIHQFEANINNYDLEVVG